MNKSSKPQISAPVKFEARFLCPRFWGIWLGIALLWLVHLLPLKAQYKVGITLGQLLYILGKKRRRLAAYNINLCFPSIDETTQAKLVKEHLSLIHISEPTRPR